MQCSTPPNPLLKTPHTACQHSPHPHQTLYPDTAEDSARATFDQSVGDLIAVYGKKALWRQTRTAAEGSSADFTMHFDEVDTRQVQAVEGVRAAFQFTRAPSITLCLALVDLCTEARQRGRLCLDIAAKLSKTLAAEQKSAERYLAIDFVRNLCCNAKLQFLRCASPAMVRECDAHISLAELLRHLLSARCNYVVSLDDLTNQVVARKLRDDLVEDDRFELAMEVAMKCHLGPTRVWAAWGIA